MKSALERSLTGTVSVQSREAVKHKPTNEPNHVYSITMTRIHMFQDLYTRE